MRNADLPNPGRHMDEVHAAGLWPPVTLAPSLRAAAWEVCQRNGIHPDTEATAQDLFDLLVECFPSSRPVDICSTIEIVADTMAME